MKLLRSPVEIKGSKGTQLFRKLNVNGHESLGS